MKIISKILACVSLLGLSACASSIQAITHAPTFENKIKNEKGEVIAGTISLTADRRLMMISTSGDNKGKFCAEPPPDAARTINSDLKATLAAELSQPGVELDADGRVEIADKVTQNIEVLYKKDLTSDIFRTGTYSICQLYLAEALSEGDVKELLTLLIKRSLPEAK